MSVSEIRAEIDKTKDKTRPKFWSFKVNNQNKGELYLYGIIENYSWWGDELTPKTFQAELDALGDDISELHVYINSDGGDVFAGQTIYSMLKRHKAQVIVHIDGIAASIATVIAMAGDIIHMPRNASMMIHGPWTYISGNAEQLRKRADDLDAAKEGMIAAYQEKTGIDRDVLLPMLAVDTWLTAEKAVELGFADVIDEDKQINACLTDGKCVINGQQMDLIRKYENVPQHLLTANASAEKEKEKANTPPETERPIRSLSLYEKRIKNNNHRRF
ncbi:head maturation protease, ClpP-related [Brevibacillus laterosporus]|uniref:head maturation protease, ClpP-related n=1 Tax=Brevibacillus laterosporus TaxID=1465 RepID=UPI000839C79F|nr:head maturation protease, ClpP-related [Brevibacillus laterosporus]